MTSQTEIPKAINELLIKHTCFTCHKSGGKLIGPSWEDIAAKKMKKSEIVANVQNPNPSNWPTYPPMASMAHVPVKDIEKIADWIVKMAPKDKK